MNLIKKEYSNPCIHCGEGIVTYSLSKDNDQYVLSSNYRCMTFDDDTEIWRGNSLKKLIKSLKNDGATYNLEQEDLDDLIDSIIKLTNDPNQNNGKNHCINQINEMIIMLTDDDFDRDEFMKRLIDMKKYLKQNNDKNID